VSLGAGAGLPAGRVEVAREGGPGLAGAEGEGRLRAVREARWAAFDRRLRRSRVHRPRCLGGGGIDVAGGVGGPNFEAVGAVGERVVSLGAGAGLPAGRVEVAREGGPGLAGAEGEGRLRAVREARWAAFDRRLRRSRVHRPGCLGGGGIDAFSFYRSYVEFVEAVRKGTVGLGTRAGRPSRAIDTALEGGDRRVGMERYADIALADRTGGGRVDHRVGGCWARRGSRARRRRRRRSWRSRRGRSWRAFCSVMA